MNPIRRELLNGLFVLVLASLLSAAIAAFQVEFNLHQWLLILIGVGVAVTGYVVFDLTLRYMASTEERETEWLKRVGTPARFEVGEAGSTSAADALVRAIRDISPGSDYTVLDSAILNREKLAKEPREVRDKALGLILEQQRRGVIREYKRIFCLESSVFKNDSELRSGVLRVGEAFGTVDRAMGEHCRLMLHTKGCSLYVAPAVLQSSVYMLGTDKMAITVSTAEEETNGSAFAGFFFFCSPPNGEIIEQFRQIERETERRMVAVHKVVFPEDEKATA